MNSLKQTILLGILVLSCLLPTRLTAGQLPDTVAYCGMRLSLTPAAKKILTDEIQKIQASKVYFDRMVLRAQKYFPYIENALAKHKVPTDLKYLTIQESSLRPNAISSSNAVGFWQFKAPTAQEVGLVVDEKVDERRHIYRSSEGAAIYLSKANFDFTNWIYAVISYYEGPTGAISHTNPDFFAVKDMVIDKDLHWYAMRAIAHKLAYHDAVQAAKEARRFPEKILEMVEVKQGVSLGKVLKTNKLSKEDFLIHNPWMLKYGQFPSKNEYFVFVPKENQANGQPEIVMVSEQKPKPQPKVEQVPPKVKTPSRATEVEESSAFPSAVPRTLLLPSQYASFPLDKDLHYGVEYIKYSPETPLSMTAMKLKTSLADILVWNGLLPGKKPEKDHIIYLKKPKKSEFHVVKEGEDLGKIAAWHKSSAKKIRKKNRLGKENHQIYIGQKLYLKAKKPKGERMIILVNDKIETELGPFKENRPISQTKSVPPAKSTQVEPEVQEIATKWVEHKVEEGETLWGISQKYQTKVEIIKMINKLPNDNIRPGQILRILSKQ